MRNAQIEYNKTTQQHTFIPPSQCLFSKKESTTFQPNCAPSNVKYFLSGTDRYASPPLFCGYPSKTKKYQDIYVPDRGRCSDLSRYGVAEAQRNRNRRPGRTKTEGITIGIPRTRSESCEPVEATITDENECNWRTPGKEGVIDLPPILPEVGVEWIFARFLVRRAVKDPVSVDR